MGPPSSTTAPTPPATTTNAQRAYKGKATRSWQQLPPELIRLVATHYLLEVSAHNHCPHAWEPRELWPYRMVYACLRDANELERLMQICPPWASALSTHLFWQTACAIIDPNDVLARHAYIQPPSNASATAVAIRHAPHRHFRNITSYSCLVCRVNYPYANNGLALGKKCAFTPTFGNISVCRDHKKNAFCSLCLRQATVPGAAEVELDMHAMCAENEDEETWPQAETTCRSCRYEALLRRVAPDPVKREATGYPRWDSVDWETRQTIEAFIDMGEGNITEVIALAMEKHWLRRFTKIAEFLSHAVAANKLASRENGANYESEDEYSDEDDDEALHISEDAGGIKMLAIDAWARRRVLDGYWCSPADQWYNMIPRDKPVTPAEHPASWSISYDSEDDPDAPHPLPETVGVETPPTYGLCEQAHGAWQRQLRNVLLPAMNNIVRRLVIECTADGVDAALKASKMTLDEVVAELRREETWFNGIDWSQRRLNGRKEQRERERQERARRTKEEDELSSSSSGKSEGSHTTSPVLSTSTLQTTPSPPPAEDKKDEDEEEALRSPATFPIPISPVLESPVLLHAIPYVPVSATDLPQYARESLKSIWREACAPLYHCRCRICERAVSNANVAAGTVVPTQTPRAPQPQIVLDDAPLTAVKAVEIPAMDASLLLARQEAAIDLEKSETARKLNEIARKLAQDNEENSLIAVQGVELEGFEMEIKLKEIARKLAQEEEESSDLEEDVRTDGTDASNVIPRKRSSLHLDAEVEEDGQEDDDDSHRTVHSRAGTPPKRVRLQGAFTGATKDRSPRRKRSSEEVDDDVAYASADEQGRRSSSKNSYKRARTEDGRTSPVSSEAASPPQTSTPGLAESEEDLDIVAVEPLSGKHDGTHTPRTHEQPSVLHSPVRTPRALSTAPPVAKADR
ncbi:hypothetical protein PUNSTDRAFT_127338 [Punctularia strigosozonata HHB-11173 SS5]|uniref:uncharacterized protein n=1 Tax=Punctularia strigosozonata (strain HHB-11173) TaxID=741275 RepID=UPI0004416FDF|nr:uncharacterized protein PUNSTDRAFT_127338 [Punctularia strigosozonata HHB-11173 SS5]EIN06641.1 hypothetical protein PUNSTDRAFT_127338 [Punctularia strigosozonata HHB-11173 SS5]